jgi:hypothetical protein
MGLDWMRNPKQNQRWFIQAQARAYLWRHWHFGINGVDATMHIFIIVVRCILNDRWFAELTKLHLYLALRSSNQTNRIHNASK